MQKTIYAGFKRVAWDDISGRWVLDKEFPETVRTEKFFITFFRLDNYMKRDSDADNNLQGVNTSHEVGSGNWFLYPAFPIP